MSEPPAWNPPAGSGGPPGRQPPSGPGPAPGWQPPSAPGPASGWPPPAGAPEGWSGPPPGQGWGPPPGWSPPPPPTQPGVVPLRPLGVAEILDGAFRTIRRYPRATLGLAALVTIVQVAISLLAAVAWGEQLAPSLQTQPGFTFRAAFTASSLVSVVVRAVTGGVLTAMVAVIVSDAVLGRPTGAAAAWRRVRPLLWRVLAVGAVVGLVPTLALVPLVLPGIFLWGAWALALPAVALERTGVGGALRRSWRLAVPDWWRVWGTRALSALVGAVVSSLLLVPAFFFGAVSLLRSSGAGGDLGVGPTVALTVTSSLGNVLVAPFLAAVLSLLYIDRRMRAEALDVTLARSVSR